MIVWRGFLPALIYPGRQGYMKSPSRVQLESYYNRVGLFPCTAASSTPIRIVTREVRYIHELSLTLEHSMPISSPAALGLTFEFPAKHSEAVEGFFQVCNELILALGFDNDVVNISFNIAM